MDKRDYKVPVNFTITYNVTIYGAESEQRAIERAEELATEDFREDLDNGDLWVADFVCEAQEPIKLEKL